MCIKIGIMLTAAGNIYNGGRPGWGGLACLFSGGLACPIRVTLMTSHPFSAVGSILYCCFNLCSAHYD